MYVTHVTFKLSGIDEEAYSGAIESLAPQYAKVPGLVSKTWVKQPDTSTYGGIYFWASKEDYATYSKSQLCDAVRSHPNLVSFQTTCYEDMPEGTAVTAGVCKF
jgi:hypothetical protein